VSAFDDEFGLFGDDEATPEEERKSTLGARQIATNESFSDDIEPEDERPARRRSGSAGSDSRTGGGERKRRETRTGTEVGEIDGGAVAEAIEDIVDRGRRMLRPSRGIGACAFGEPVRVHAPSVRQERAVDRLHCAS